MILRKIKNAKTKISNKYKTYNERKKLNNTDFTIISNNCWGGFVYQKFGMEYLSPTIGLFIMEADYLKFVYDLKGYIKHDLKFIEPSDSKYYNQLTNNGEKPINYPVARLGDIDIFFMHYHSKEEAIEKWARRCKKINFNNMIIKLSEREDCTEETIQQFSKLSYDKKILFTQKEQLYSCCKYIEGLDKLNETGGDETELVLSQFDVVEFINGNNQNKK